MKFQCLVEDCRFYQKPIVTDSAYFKGHLKEHDCKELQETASKLGLLEYPSERRSPKWLVDRLTETSIVREVEV